MRPFFDEEAEYLKYNVLEIRYEVIEMVLGQEIDITIKEYISVNH